MQATKRASKRLSKYMLDTLLRPSTPPTTNTSTTTPPTTTTTNTAEMARNDEAAQRQREEDYLFAEPAEGHVRIDQIADSELVKLFDPAGPGVTESGYVSARHVGIPIVQIAGMGTISSLYISFSSSATTFFVH
jgi:flagellar basal body rod protein FlgC